MHGRRLQQGLVATLDGEALDVVAHDDDVELRHGDGRPVPEDRLSDVVYLNPGADDSDDAWWISVALVSLDGVLYDEPVRSVSVQGETFTGDDVANMLAAVADAHLPKSAPVVEAAFFHQTLLAWLGEASNDDTPRPIPWPSGLWKATLDEEEAEQDAIPSDGAHVFAARVFAADQTEPMTFRYWVKTDADEQVVESGWLSPPPDLFGVAEEADRARRKESEPVVVPDLFAD